MFAFSAWNSTQSSKKKAWIPACSSGKQLSRNFACPGHTSLVPLSFSQQTVSMDPYLLCKRVGKVTCPTLRSTCLGTIGRNFRRALRRSSALKLRMTRRTSTENCIDATDGGRIFVGRQREWGPWCPSLQGTGIRWNRSDSWPPLSVHLWWWQYSLDQPDDRMYWVMFVPYLRTRIPN